MHIIDSHFHWWPRPFFEDLCRRTEFPRAAVNDLDGYTYMRRAEGGGNIRSWAAWYDLDEQLAHMDGLGHRVDVVSSIGPFSVYFSELEPSHGRDEAMKWNEHMAGAQRAHPGRFWASAAIRPAMELMFTMWPEPRSLIPGSTAWTQRITPQ